MRYRLQLKMIFHVYKNLSKAVLTIDRLERIMVRRFQLYNLPVARLPDTDDWDGQCDRVGHLMLAFVALDHPTFADLFVRGEVKVFMLGLKSKSCAEIKEELSVVLSDLKYFSQREEFGRLGERDGDRMRLALNALDNLIQQSGHTFGVSHSTECTDLTMIVPFTLPLDLVARRRVTLSDGKVAVPCGLWADVLESVYGYYLRTELGLLRRCTALRRVIHQGEDDRLRRVVRRFGSLLNGGDTVAYAPSGGHLRAADLDEASRHFPPCMANLHQILRRTHRLSYESRYQYTLFLKDIGVPVHENISLWETEYSKPGKGSNCCHEWTDKHDRYRYQIEHMYGLIGSREVKTSHPCTKFTGPIQSKMDGGCPFRHETVDSLRASMPESVVHVPDLEDVFRCVRSNLPQRACRVYLSCLERVSWGRGRRRERPPGPTATCIVSPLQYYNIAKAVL